MASEIAQDGALGGALGGAQPQPPRRRRTWTTTTAQCCCVCVGFSTVGDVRTCCACCGVGVVRWDERTSTPMCEPTCERGSAVAFCPVLGTCSWGSQARDELIWLCAPPFGHVTLEKRKVVGACCVCPCGFASLNASERVYDVDKVSARRAACELSTQFFCSCFLHLHLQLVKRCERFCACCDDSNDIVCCARFGACLTCVWCCLPTLGERFGACCWGFGGAVHGTCLGAPPTACCGTPVACGIVKATDPATEPDASSDGTCHVSSYDACLCTGAVNGYVNAARIENPMYSQRITTTNVCLGGYNSCRRTLDMGASYDRGGLLIPATWRATWHESTVLTACWGTPFGGAMQWNAPSPQRTERASFWHALLCGRFERNSKVAWATCLPPFCITFQGVCVACPERLSATLCAALCCACSCTNAPLTNATPAPEDKILCCFEPFERDAGLKRVVLGCCSGAWDNDGCVAYSCLGFARQLVDADLITAPPTAPPAAPPAVLPTVLPPAASSAPVSPAFALPARSISVHSSAHALPGRPVPVHSRTRADAAAVAVAIAVAPPPPQVRMNLCPSAAWSASPHPKQHSRQHSKPHPNDV
jgi:hypothetical protein